MTWEAIGPEAVLALTKGDLKLDILLFVPVFLEEVDGMLERGRSTLHTIIHPGSAVLVLIDGDGCSLPAEDGHALDDGHLELVWMLSQSMGA